MPGVTNSYILSQAIYCYNFTIARHTVAKCDINVNDLGIHSVKLLHLNYSSPLIIHDLLERLNFISGKILKFIDSVSLAPTPELFAHELFKNKIIDVGELTDNLIHCVPGSSLGVCLLDYSKIILFFSVPGDNVENIVELGKNTRVVELLFRAYQYHQTLDEKHKKQWSLQTKKTEMFAIDSSPALPERSLVLASNDSFSAAREPSWQAPSALSKSVLIFNHQC